MSERELWLSARAIDFFPFFLCATRQTTKNAREKLFRFSLLVLLLVTSFSFFVGWFSIRILLFWRNNWTMSKKSNVKKAISLHEFFKCFLLSVTERRRCQSLSTEHSVRPLCFHMQWMDDSRWKWQNSLQWLCRWQNQCVCCVYVRQPECNRWLYSVVLYLVNLYNKRVRHRHKFHSKVFFNIAKIYSVYLLFYLTQFSHVIFCMCVCVLCVLCACHRRHQLFDLFFLVRSWYMHTLHWHSGNLFIAVKFTF